MTGVEQIGLFAEFPVDLGGRRPLGHRRGHGSGGITAAVRLAVFTLCRNGKRVTTDSTGHPMSRVRSAFRALERERLIKVGSRRCRNPLGYRLVARLHPRLKYLRISPVNGGTASGLSQKSTEGTKR